MLLQLTRSIWTNCCYIGSIATVGTQGVIRQKQEFGFTVHYTVDGADRVNKFRSVTIEQALDKLRKYLNVEGGELFEDPEGDTFVFEIEDNSHYYFLGFKSAGTNAASAYPFNMN